MHVRSLHARARIEVVRYVTVPFSFAYYTPDRKRLNNTELEIHGHMKTSPGIDGN